MKDYQRRQWHHEGKEHKGNRWIGHAFFEQKRCANDQTQHKRQRRTDHQPDWCIDTRKVYYWITNAIKKDSAIPGIAAHENDGPIKMCEWTDKDIRPKCHHRQQRNKANS